MLFLVPGTTKLCNSVRFGTVAQKVASMQVYPSCKNCPRFGNTFDSNPDLPLPWKDMAYWPWLDPVSCHVICIQGKLLFNLLTVEWSMLEVGWTGGGTSALQLNCVLHSTNRVWVLEIQLLYNNFLGYGAINSTFSVDWQLPELIYCVGWWLAMGDACFGSKCWSWSVLLHIF